MTRKVTHPESVSKILHIFSILTDHAATSQLTTTKSQVTGVYMIKKNTKRNEIYVEIVCYLLYIIHPRSIFSIFLIIF